MKPPLHFKKLALSAFLVSTLGLSTAANSATEDNTRAAEISELIYKSALFPFYQEDYFTGMTALHVGQEKGLISTRDNEADILLGSLYLSYGMYEDAEAIFLRLSETLKDQKTANRIWLQLAEIYYQTQNYTQAKDSLERITDKLPSSLKKRKAFIHGNTLLELGEYEAAVNLLTKVDKNDIWYYYGLFNIGVKLLETEQTNAGYNSLNHLVDTPPPAIREVRHLQDKARLTLGYFELKSGKTKSAINYFSSISLNSPYALWGLYGLGRSAYAEEDYKSALKYWLALERKSNDNSPIIEAHLATSQLYFRLGALQQSLVGFEETMALCETEIGKINASIDHFKRTNSDTSHVALLLRNDPSTLNAEGFEPVLNRQGFVEMLASAEFNNLKQNYTDLEFYKQHLLAWQTSIEAFNEILNTRKQAFDTQLPRIMNRHETMQLPSLAQQQHELSELAQTIANDENATALANEDELKLLEKITKIDTKLATLNGKLEPDQYQQLANKYELLSGVLNWNLATDFKPRLRKVNKGLHELASLIEEANKLDALLRLAQKNSPEQFASYNNKISQYAKTIVVLIATVDEISKQIESETQKHIIDTLEQRKESITKVHTHARFAVAQIYDMSINSARKSENLQP